MTTNETIHIRSELWYIRQQSTPFFPTKLPKLQDIYMKHYNVWRMNNRKYGTILHTLPNHATMQS